MEMEKSMIIKIARHQRWLITVIIARIILLAVNFATMQKTGPSIKILILAIVIGLSFAAIRAVAILMTSMGDSVALVVICCILLIVPLIGLLVLLSINGRATKALKAAGLRVGLLGVDLSELDKEDS